MDYSLSWWVRATRLSPLRFREGTWPNASSCSKGPAARSAAQQQSAARCSLHLRDVQHSPLRPEPNTTSPGFHQGRDSVGSADFRDDLMKVTRDDDPEPRRFIAH